MVLFLLPFLRCHLHTNTVSSRPTPHHSNYMPVKLASETAQVADFSTLIASSDATDLSVAAACNVTAGKMQP